MRGRLLSHTPNAQRPPSIILPEHLRSLYKGWEHNPPPSLTPFQKYYRTILRLQVNNMAVCKWQTITDFSCCDSQPTDAKINKDNDLQTQDFPGLSQLKDLLEPRMPAPLTDMSRFDPKNRRSNEIFTVMLKHKLRFPLWSERRLHFSFKTGAWKIDMTKNLKPKEMFLK